MDRTPRSFQEQTFPEAACLYTLSVAQGSLAFYGTFLSYLTLEGIFKHASIHGTHRPEQSLPTKVKDTAQPSLGVMSYDESMNRAND